MLHQSGTPPRPQSETCLRPAANACAIWYQQAPTQDHANLDCDQSSGRFRQFLEGRGGISIVLVARSHRSGFRKQPSAALLPWQWVPASASRGPPSSTGPVRCDLRSSEIGCHGLGGLAATLVKRPIEIIEAPILPARLRVTQQVEGLHSLVPPRPLRRLPQSILCPTPYEVIAPFRQSRIRPRIRIMVDGRADLPGSRGNHGAGCGPHCGKSLRRQPAKRPGHQAFPDRPKRSAGRSNA